MIINRRHIKDWAKGVSLVSEGYEGTQEDGDQSYQRACLAFDSLAQTLGLEFQVYRDDDDEFGPSYKTYKELRESFPDEKAETFVVGKILRGIEENPGDYGITYHDDSDYSDEGYGQAGDFDEREMAEEARDIFEEEVGDFMNGLEGVNGDGRLAQAYEKLMKDCPKGEVQVKKWLQENPLVYSKPQGGNYPSWALFLV